MPNRRSRLGPAELAEAAVMADLAALTVVIARLTPLAGVTTLIGAVPFAVLALRHRLAVVTVAFWIACILVFLLSGFGPATQVLVMALFGGLVGRALARGWSRPRLVLAAVAFGWTTVAGLTLVFLSAFANLRRLNLEAVEVQWGGLARILRALSLDRVAERGDAAVSWSVSNWWIAVPLFQLVVSAVLVLLVLRVARPVVSRVRHGLSEPPAPTEELIELADRLLDRPGLTVVTGANGAGKSSLLRTMAQRRGDVGRRGGTAIIGQRPDAQVVGARVIDDLRWGLEPTPPGSATDAVLARVGLGSQADRETASLSGGELQRLAVAAALLRQPAVVLSDESTAMIDPAGRAGIMALLRELADNEVTVVHVTHLDPECDLADHRVEL